MTSLSIPKLSPGDHASLAADDHGVAAELERYRRQVDSGFYLAVTRQQLGLAIDASPLPAAIRGRLAQRLGGRGYRSNSTIRSKYQKIAGSPVPQDESPKAHDRVLAIVEDKACFLKRSTIKTWQRKHLAEVFSRLAPGGSVIEVGAGDLGMLVGIARVIEPKPHRLGAADISEKRLIVGRDWARSHGVNIDAFAAADAARLPFGDREWDIVFTSNCLEQNLTGVAAIVHELYRVSAKYLVMVEPAYELGSPLYQRHIRKIGHVRGIPAVIHEAGWKLVHHELLPVREYLHDISLTVVARGDA